MEPFVHLIADYGEKDPAFSEVVHRLKSENSDLQVQTMSMPRFSTIATGFWIAQIGLHNPRLGNSAIYANTAPRKHDEKAQVENCGRELVYAELENGVPVLAVNSGYSLSFVKNSIMELREVEIPEKGSQFRSRDFFPEAVAGILEGDESYIGEKIDKECIPEAPDSKIAFIDGYGNIKTSIRESEIELKPGDEVEIEIDGETRKAFYEAGTFCVEEGALSFAPGSSGGEDPFMEVFLRGGSASETFGNPGAGAEIKFHSD
ncbi:MAG: S-adenosyl-l-methionine hydroxide adenosyltransferase family protein [Candidatus Nanohalobium sp.]